jgi:hypothetical protein
MAGVEKVSVALTSDMRAMLRQAVATGDYASTSEAMREALRQWKATRSTAIAPSMFEKAPARANNLFQGQRNAIAQLCRQHGVRHLALFGSTLREDFDSATSDIDLVVDFTQVPDQSPARQYFDFKAALEQLFGRDVDLVEIDSMPDSRLRRRIERTQVLLYAEES